ncbi:MAG TPA: FeoA family protein [Burkholderiales bacterium]
MPLDDAPENLAMPGEQFALSRAGVGQVVTIRALRTGPDALESGDIGLRLLELGFVEGESLRVIAAGFPDGEPIAVRIGSTTFALRRFEADHVLVTALPQPDAKS